MFSHRSRTTHHCDRSYCAFNCRLSRYIWKQVSVANYGIYCHIMDPKGHCSGECNIQIPVYIYMYKGKVQGLIYIGLYCTSHDTLYMHFTYHRAVPWYYFPSHSAIPLLLHDAMHVHDIYVTVTIMYAHNLEIELLPCLYA